MRALTIGERGLELRDDVLAPPVRAGECRVQVLVAGVCATDLALARGYMGFRGVPGHEFVGRALDGPLAGRRVVGEINASCGRCAICRAGGRTHCPERTVLGILGRSGAFADELVLPAENLHAVPDTVTTDAATFTEPLAAAHRILEQVEVGPATRAVVIGDGRLGLLCAQVLARVGADVALIGRHAERSALAGGLPWIDLASARGADLVVEASGAPELLARALECVRPRGTVVLKTTSEAPATVDLAPLVVNEVTVIGSRCGPFPPALAALARGEVAVAPMIHARFPLERARDALETAARPGVLKVLIDVEERAS